MKPFDLFIFAGEDSGDLHGFSLIQELRKKNPSLTICGVGGNKMSPLLDRVLFRSEELTVMGFFDVLLLLKRIVKRFFFLRKELLKLHPSLCVFIDYAEFNLLLERSLRKKGYRGKIIHYISPSVWAWRKSRAQTLASNVDHLLTIFPFEKACYASTSLPVTYVGNPLVNSLSSQNSPKPASSHLRIGLFPGSRKKEVKDNLPYLLQAAEDLLHEDSKSTFILSQASKEMALLMEKDLSRISPKLKKRMTLLSPQCSKKEFPSLDFAIAKSGTINLELALFSVPTIVIFAIRFWDLLILRDLLRIRLPHYCIVNIIAGKEIFPELYGPNLTKETLKAQCHSLLRDVKRRQEMKKGCEEVKKILGNENASQKASEVILSYFK